LIPFLPINDISLGQHVKDLTIRGDVHSLGSLKDAFNIFFHHFPLSYLYNPCTVESLDMPSCNPTYTDWISTPAMISASSTAFLIDWIVLSTSPPRLCGVRGTGVYRYL